MKSPLRICHFSASRGLGRGEVYVDLANTMASSHVGSTEVSLLVPKDALFKGRVDSHVQLIEYTSHDSRNNPALWYELYGLIKQLSPDIIHTHFSKATEIYRKINTFTKKPYVATKHNPRKGTVFEKVDHVIAVSEAVRRSIRKGHAKVIHNGITPGLTTTSNRLANRKLELLSVGRLNPIKGFDLLIEALAEVDIPWNLTILGEGSHRKYLEELIARKDLSKCVNLPGFRTDIQEQMTKCDAYIVSSHSEGCSVALLEAMHYAPLVFSTAVGLAEDLFPDWLIWDNHAPQTLSDVLLDYQSRRDKFKTWAEPLLPEFHMNVVVEKHIELYRKILGK